MKLKLLSEVINGTVVLESNPDQEIAHIFSTDLMSDALALVDGGEDTMILTGLCNMQTLRTAEMLDINTIIFVRNKFPDEEMIEHAKKMHFNMYSTAYTMYESCGLLFKAGLKP